jgi:acetophenone carboxylase
MNGVTYGRDYEVVQRLRPEPVTPEEARAMEHIDPTDLEIFSHKMNMIAFEGKETTQKLGASAGMRWGDVAFGIFTTQGDLAVCATAIYFHAALAEIPVKYIVKHWTNEPSVGVREGDSFFWNDSFYGGAHGADMGIAVPVFYQGKLICFTGAIVHTGENGSTEPGGAPNSSRSRYDEGFLVPPLKIGENYTLREDIVSMFANAGRDPRTFILDLKARLAACRIAQRRIVDLVEKIGVDLLIGGLRKILLETAKAAKKKVAELPNGVFRHEVFMDSVGPQPCLLKISVELEKKGDTMKLNLSDTSPALRDLPMNTYFQGIIALAMVYLCGWQFHDLPANNALLEVLEWKFPEDAIVNASGDMPTAQAPLTQTAFGEAFFHLGAKLIYNCDAAHAGAPWYVGFGMFMYGGFNQWGEPIADVAPEMNATASGGRCDMDGVDVSGSFFATMSDCSDVETTEVDKPFVYLFRNHFQNHGMGKYRGGNGVGYALMVHGVPLVFVGAAGYGSKFPSTTGLFGGYAAPTPAIHTVRGSKVKEMWARGSDAVPSTLLEFETSKPLEGVNELCPVGMLFGGYEEGDVLSISRGGGAGYGDVLERDPELVVHDVKIDAATPWQAKNVYKVVYDEKTFRLDREATQKARDEARAERLRLGIAYDEFEKEWSKKRPPEEILKHYGTYPHPSEGLAKGR